MMSASLSVPLKFEREYLPLIAFGIMMRFSVSSFNKEKISLPLYWSFIY